ncbi:MAG: GDP-mannose 4,6-dehydratase [bacterium]|nr:GDP-mannose 4,6-dehydratase [bacterium]
MNKVALITGSEGFVGPYLKRELEDYGYNVFGIGCEESKKENYYCADITDKNLLKTIIESIRPKYVFHLAGISSQTLATNNPEKTYDLNIEGTRNLLDVLSPMRDVRTLIVSSSHVYGRPEYLPVDERHLLNGKSAYAESRIKQEKLVQSYMDKMKIIISRSFNHTGPAQNDAFIIPKIMSQIVEVKNGKRDFLELGDINVKRDILDVRDVVKAYVLLLEQNKFGETYNVCRGKSISLHEVIEYGKRFAGLKELDVRVNPAFIGEDDIIDIYGDNSHLREFINWRPLIDYESMLRDIFNYWDKM